MKRIRTMTLCVLLLASGVSVADDKKKVDMDECNQMDQIAESVMRARQNGAPMSEMYKILVKGDDYTSQISKVIIDGAYREERYGSEEYKTRAVQDYRNMMFQACIGRNS